MLQENLKASLKIGQLIKKNLKILISLKLFRNLTLNITFNICLLKYNPFIDRIYATFSNKNGIMSFEHFLNMMSVFSDSCPTDLKAKYAFKIYGIFLILF